MNRKLLTIGGAGLVMTLMTGCAGGAGGNSSSSGDTGVEYGATPEEYQDALVDMEPITLTYQSTASSPTEPMALRSQSFADNVQEVSGGKISIDVVYGHAIAGTGEIADALADGRLDLAYELLMYEPSKYPATDALYASTAVFEPSPLVGEMAANAAFLDVAWSTPELHDELEHNGLVPLMPVDAAGTVFSICGDGGVDLDTWDGRQIRVSGTVQQEQVRELGGSPVSMNFLEVYEGLQRNVVDCTLMNLNTGIPLGLIEVAANVSYPETNSFTRGAGGFFGGLNFKELPLAAQQLIFDQVEGYFGDSLRSSIGSGADASERVNQSNGSFLSFSEEADDALSNAYSSVEEYLSETGNEDMLKRMSEAYEYWTDAAVELGYQNEGDYGDFHEWFDSEEFSPDDFAAEFFEQVVLPHRPA